MHILRVTVAVFVSTLLTGCVPEPEGLVLNGLDSEITISIREASKKSDFTLYPSQAASLNGINSNIQELRIFQQKSHALFTLTAEKRREFLAWQAANGSHFVIFVGREGIQLLNKRDAYARLSAKPG